MFFFCCFLLEYGWSFAVCVLSPLLVHWSASVVLFRVDMVAAYERMDRAEHYI